MLLNVLVCLEPIQKEVYVKEDLNYPINDFESQAPFDWECNEKDVTGAGVRHQEKDEYVKN